MSIASSRPGAVAPSPVNEPNVDSNIDQNTDQPQGSPLIEIPAQQQGQVDLETSQADLAHYLQQHQSWVARCFKPLKVEALDPDSASDAGVKAEVGLEIGQRYRLQFFKIGGLGFELEPSFGVRIWQESETLFRLSSIELPSDEGLPYTVNCEAYFELEQLSLSPDTNSPDTNLNGKASPNSNTNPNSKDPVTRVHWRLELNISMTLPRFLQALPRQMVYGVGSNVVCRVTRTMSDRLTQNVCQDFYRSIGKPGQPYRLVHLSAVNTGKGC